MGDAMTTNDRGDEPPARRRLDPAERRAQILGAARSLFGAATYEGVSTHDIAAAAGVTRGLITHYFGGKRELFLESVRQMLSFPALVIDSLPKVSPEQRAAIAVDRWLDVVERNKDMWLAAIRARSMRSEPDLEEIIQQAYEDDVDLVLRAAMLEDVVEGKETLRAMVRAFGGLAREATREWLVHETMTRAEVHVYVTDVLLHILQTTFPAVRAAGKE